MIKVIAVDLGGVYFSHGSRVAAQKLGQDYGYDPAVINQLLSSIQSQDLRKGLMSDEEFWDWAQGTLPQGYDAQLVKRVWYDSYILDTDIEALVKALRARHYKVIVFSGNIKSRVDYLENKYHFKANFDQEIYSYDYHTIKPEKEFVQVLLDQAGCKPEEILYLDNKLDDAAPAIERGMNVAIYNRGEIEGLHKELEKYGIKLK